MADLGLRRTTRGEDSVVEGNAEYALVLPDVDKTAVVALATVELAAVITESTVWSPELHLAALAAIAGLGGYSLSSRQDGRAEDRARDAE